jgi:phage tail-like protein
MAQVNRNDPYGAFNFIVEIDGVAVAGFSECSGLSSETDVIEYREGSDLAGVRKIAGLTKFSSITLKRGITKNRDLWNWRKTIINGGSDRRAGRIVLIGEDRSPVVSFRFLNGWPSKFDGPRLNARSSEVAIESLEITHEGLDIE